MWNDIQRLLLAWQCLRQNGREDKQDAGAARLREMRVCFDGSFPDWREHEHAICLEKAVRGNQELKCVRELERERARGMPERTPAEGGLRGGKPGWQKVVSTLYHLEFAKGGRGGRRQEGVIWGGGKEVRFLHSQPGYLGYIKHNRSEEEWKGRKRREVY